MKNYTIRHKDRTLVRLFFLTSAQNIAPMGDGVLCIVQFNFLNDF